jgi:O-methyltransferase involved in polyketide biosynthesis
MATSLLTLYGKAIDARRKRPVLGDAMSAEILKRIDYDFKRARTAAVLMRSIAPRAKHFDDWSREFLEENDRATVVHLGCGLDTRPWRISTGPDVAWYDLDHPDVVGYRKRLFPDRDNYTLLGCSVTQTDWIEDMPSQTPVLVVAEGLSMYLDPAAGQQMFRRISEHFRSGVVVLDGMSRLGLNVGQLLLSRALGSGLLRWPLDHPRELEHAAPRLRCTHAISGLATPSALLLGTHMRVLSAASRHLAPLREIDTYFRFEFGPTTGSSSAPG